MTLTRSWFQILLTGVVLFFGSEQALRWTGNPNLVPTVIMVGASVVPAAFVAYFYGQERAVDKAVHGEAPLIPVLVCFLVGGTIGVVIAGLIEYQTLRNLGVGSLFGVGLVEETVKMLFPIAIYIIGRYTSESDGLLFGVASGMGFAVLETMGFGMVALISSQGDVASLEQVLLLRGLLSPVGHAAWTGLVCASLWRGRLKSGKMFNPGIIGIFLLAVVLHASWDLFGSFNVPAVVIIGYAIVGGISLTMLVRRWREARRPA